MRLAALLILAGALHAAPVRLAPGDNRFMQFTVTRVPTLVDCRFRVLRGSPTVHMEILAHGEYRRFIEGHDYDAMALTQDGAEGQIRRMLDDRGRFDVVVMNAPGAPVAMVDLEVRTDLDPNADSVARELAPGRRLAVILISFAIFFGLVTFSAMRLLREGRRKRLPHI
jgi:hypothetical protein